MSRRKYLENILIWSSGAFGVVFAGGPIVFLYRNQILGIWDSTEEIEDFEEVLKIKYEAARAKELLNDYSFKIFLPCKSNGTGWILDFEIPKNQEEYPTTWYIATNAHVANQFKFASNDYGQTLPTAQREPWKVQTPKLKLNDGNTCRISQDPNWFDFSLSKPENGRETQSNFGAISDNKIAEPSLFYAPIDFLKGEGIPKNNYKDFAVIKIDFRSAHYAEQYTNGFHRKYTERKEREPLNVFASPWDKVQNQKDVRLYTLGYEWSKEFDYSFSYDGHTKTTKLARNKKGADSEGRVSAQAIDGDSIKTNWNGTLLNRVGHSYLLDNFAMKGGVSGGLVINAEGELWALKSVADERSDQSYVVPLRSKPIDHGNWKTPGYDLIEGGFEGQLTSYKKQVQDHILKNDRKTWLSELRGWKKEDTIK